MKLTLERAPLPLPEDCESIFFNSAIYERYFRESGRLGASLTKAAENGQLYLAVAGDGQLAGAMKVVMGGFCGLYPYLALIGVRDSFRGHGVGAFLMDGLEQMSRDAGARRVTLMVSDFNLGAQRFYESRGYWRLGEIPNATKQGIGEIVMIKDL